MPKYDDMSPAGGTQPGILQQIKNLIEGFRNNDTAEAQIARQTIGTRTLPEAMIAVQRGRWTGDVAARPRETTVTAEDIEAMERAKDNRPLRPSDQGRGGALRG